VANDSLFFPIVEEVVMLYVFVMEQIYENQVVVDEGAVNEWVREVVDRHRMVVKTEGFVDVQLILLDFFGSPILFSEHSAIKVPIVEIAASKYCSRCVLLDFITLDVADIFAILIFSASINFHKGHFACLQGELMEVVSTVTPFCDGDGRPGVISYDARNHWVLSLNLLRSSQTGENVIKVLETLVWLNVLVRLRAKGFLLLLGFDHELVSQHFFLELIPNFFKIRLRSLVHNIIFFLNFN
jgi:hypothetical protein